MGAVTVGILLVGTAGAAGALAGAVVSSLGASALAGAASTATTIGGYALAAGIGVDAVNSSIAVGTGTNYIAKGAYSLFGSKNQTEQDFVNGYGEARDILYMASLSYGTVGAYALASGFSSQKSIEEGSEAIPDKVKDIANQVKSKNGTPPQGYKGGKVYQNIPKEGAQKLPEGINYKEYDVNPYIKGQDRGMERIIIGDDGSVWYTDNHYDTFTKIE